MPETMKIYLDNCCFNRPYDDQSQLRIMLESEAKLKIQENIRSGVYTLVWSYILDYENNKNPFRERREQIAKWRAYCEDDIEENNEIINTSNVIYERGIKKIDALHIACSIQANVEYFLTTDDQIIRRSSSIQNVKIIDPIGFIKEMAI